ncbi:MAG: hypothetical protein GX644_02470, partial [Limnobacter sp.]|nr:hypothetical protein [Limnobacter sp.]
MNPTPSDTHTVIAPGDRPLVLLPVRLETRFFGIGGDSTELRVRVYPDKIHLDTHEPELLTTEREWGAHYWEQDWRAGNDEVARAAAWRQHAERFGGERAAWIARALAPTNPQQRPATPTPADQPLPVAPVLADAPTVADDRAGAWRRAPLARLLPTRWIALLRSGRLTARAVGNEIAKPLAAGPDPADDGAPGGGAPGGDPSGGDPSGGDPSGGDPSGGDPSGGDPSGAGASGGGPSAAVALAAADELAIDAGMKWMVDFDEAEAKGMGLRIAVPPQMLAGSAEAMSLLVFGVNGDSDDAGPKLAELLDAHHYTDGLGFLRQGSPTNNTEDRRADATADDAAHERSFATEIAFDPGTLTDDSNALRTGVALGLPAAAIAATLGRLPEAAALHGRDQRSMNLALWQAGWGYYFGNLVGFDGTGLTPAALAWAREHFASHVRAGGALPVLRCGRQPYGLLPVTSLDLWQPDSDADPALRAQQWLRTLLIRLRDNVWRPRLDEAYRIGRRTSPRDPDADLADVMRTDAVSSAYRTRHLFGRHYLQHLRAFIGEDLEAAGFLAAANAGSVGILQRLNIDARPRLARTVSDAQAWPVTAPLVQAGEVSPWRTLEPNFIAELLQADSIGALIEARPAPSLLQALLRHALLREIADAAANIAASANGGDAGLLARDAELVDLVSGAPPTPTWRRQLEQVVGAVTGTATIGEYLQSLDDFSAPQVAALGEFRAALEHLAARDSEALQLLMQGALDLAAHRLDAWISAFANRRLDAMKAGGATGSRVGGYGYVENLRPGPAPVPVPAPPPGEPGPLFTRTTDTGFIHAPSLTHAAAAALLRNSHLGASGVPAADSPFAIRLSSRRVRVAQQLLDGVRQGQRLGALLGYRFERALHEIGFDALILPLRKLAPLDLPESASAAAREAVAANNVVDGLELSRRWQAEPAVVLDAVKPRLSGTMQARLERELTELAAMIDGLSDALVAESAYQMARGNTTRVASTLAAIAQGDAPPPDLEVARTPRSGTALTHRLLVLWSGEPAATPGWLPADAAARSAAEPMLNHWASMLIGDPRRIRCTVECVDDAGTTVEVQRFALAELSLCPLDLVYGVESDTGAVQPPDTACEIEQRVLYQARRRAGGWGDDALLRLQHARPSDLAADELSLFEALEQARTLRRLLSSARGADAEDLNPPERRSDGTLALAELEARVHAAEDALAAAHRSLTELAGEGDDAEALRGALLALGAFGVAPATPTAATGNDAEAAAALSVQAGALLRDSAARLAHTEDLRAQPPAAEPHARCDRLVERMQAVFGRSFAVMPRFSCGSPAAAELSDALAAGG